MWNRNAFLTLSVVLAVGTAAAAVNADLAGTALEVHSPDITSVALTSDLEARKISLGLYTVNIGVLGTFTGYSCMAAFAVPVNYIADAACAAGALATLGYLIASHWIVASSSSRRDAAQSSLPQLDGIVFNFDHIEGFTATYAMNQAFGAAEGDEPILVAYHPCETTGCYNYLYHTYEHPTIGTVHKLMQRPRGAWHQNSTSHAKRDEYTDETAYEDSETASDGTAIYGTYIYWDVTPSDENTLGNEYSGQDVAEGLFDVASTNNEFTNQGYYCVDIVDEEHGGAVPSTGYFDVSAGENMDDPDNEQSYLEMCYDDELGAKRRVRRSRIRV